MVLKKVGFILVLLMAILQGVYGIYAFVAPSEFAVFRGTSLVSPIDSDWVQVYASRTIFVSLLIGLLLYLEEYRILRWAALFGTVMPITDAVLAYEAHAAGAVIYKHVATAIYLVATFIVLTYLERNRKQA